MRTPPRIASSLSQPQASSPALNGKIKSPPGTPHLTKSKVRIRRTRKSITYLLSVLIMALSCLTIFQIQQQEKSSSLSLSSISHSSSSSSSSSTTSKSSSLASHLNDFAQQPSTMKKSQKKQQQAKPSSSSSTIVDVHQNHPDIEAANTTTAAAETTSPTTTTKTTSQQYETQTQKSFSNENQHHQQLLVGEEQLHNLPEFHISKSMKELLKTNFWPEKSPSDMFADSSNNQDCQVIFKDKTMSTCHLGAFGGNFGDMIGPDIVKRILEYHFEGCSATNLPTIDFYQTQESPGPCLWTVGSIWRQVRPNDHAWGSGTLGKDTELRSSACRGFGNKFNNVTVYSVRGPKTQALVELACEKRLQIYDFAKGETTKNLTGTLRPYGDAGFLIPFLFPELTQQSDNHDNNDKHDSCLVLHKYDEEEIENKKISSSTASSSLFANHKILPVVQSWQSMADSIANICKQVSSSSLHGLILADAFGIPAWWIKGSSSIFPFKFHDYFESVGRTMESSSGLNDFLSHSKSKPQVNKANIPLPYHHRSNYAKIVLESFPFHLFTTTTPTTAEAVETVYDDKPHQSTRSNNNDETASDAIEEEDTGNVVEEASSEPVIIDKSLYLKKHEIANHLKDVWPQQSPRELFGSDQFDSCQVVFTDELMFTCHLGAFGGNFGDMIGPAIVKRIVEYYFGCSASQLPVADFAIKGTDKWMKKQPCLFTVGSVWRNVRKNDHVWGTGSLGKESELVDGPCLGPKTRFNNITVHSVRGPKTVGWLSEKCQNKLRVIIHVKKDGERGMTSDTTKIRPAGDAGFLIPFLFPEYDSRGDNGAGKEACVILHKYDEETFTNREVVGNASMLPVIQPWETMYANITQCQIVSSSSLHGLILADAYGIPARYIRRSGSILKDKFEDYAESLGREEKLEDIKLIDVFTNPKLHIPKAMSYNKRSLYAAKVLETFPFHLFTTTGTTDAPLMTVHPMSPMKSLLNVPIDLIEASMNAENELIEASNPRLYQPPLIDLLKLSDWPNKAPVDMYGAEKFQSCHVKFKDSTMSTCHLGAFGGNFGDMLGPDIVKRIVEYHFGCTAENLPVIDFETETTEGPCLFSVGSVWRNVRNNDHVWGTGSLGKDMEFRSSACQGFQSRFNNVTVYSVRGPRTVALIELACQRRIQIYLPEFGVSTKSLVGKVRPYGDAGFLIPFLFPEIVKAEPSIAKFKSCLILHRYDEEQAEENQRDLGGYHQRLPVVQSWQTMAGNLTQCQVVSSSSLHGLMLSDAYGIPARWIWASSSVFPFKFQDYQESLNATGVTLQRKRIKLRTLLAEDQRGNLTVPEILPQPSRSAYAKRVLESFPFHLFTTAERRTIDRLV